MPAKCTCERNAPCAVKAGRGLAPHFLCREQLAEEFDKRAVGILRPLGERHEGRGDVDAEDARAGLATANHIFTQYADRHGRGRFCIQCEKFESFIDPAATCPRRVNGPIRITIWGPPKTGKTTLLKIIVDAIQERAGVAVRFQTQDDEQGGPAAAVVVVSEFVTPRYLVPIDPQARADKEPCGECHLHRGETCNICGAKRPMAGSGSSHWICGLCDQLNSTGSANCERAGCAGSR